jgi:hypothetical protein
MLLPVTKNPGLVVSIANVALRDMNRDLWWEVNNPGGTAGSCSADFGLTLVDD